MYTPKSKHRDTNFIFGDGTGNPYNFRKSFETALKRARISDFRFHDLRHTFCSHLSMAGVSLNTIRELAGHKSIEMTLRYAHLSPEHKSKAVEILSDKMGLIYGTTMAPTVVSDVPAKYAYSATALISSN